MLRIRENSRRKIIIISIALLGLSLLILSACSEIDMMVPGTEKSLMIQEEFVLGRTGTWLLEGDELGSSEIIPEQLIIELNAPDTIQYATLREPAFDDFILEVDGHLVRGAPSSSYGVLFRMVGPEEFYRFEITADGMYMLEKHNFGGGWSRLTGDWQESGAIQQGLNSVNHLKIEAIGPNINIYVNDHLLERVQDDAYSYGTIALDAGTFGNSNAAVSFDNLIVYPPPQ